VACCCNPQGAAAAAQSTALFLFWSIPAGSVNGNFFNAWGGTTLGALSEPNSTIRAPRPGALTALRLGTADGSVVAADQTAVIRVNGINTTLSATIPAGQSTGVSGAVLELVGLQGRISLIAATNIGPLVASVELI
jgi:hypothetical protein